MRPTAWDTQIGASDAEMQTLLPSGVLTLQAAVNIFTIENRMKAALAQTVSLRATRMLRRLLCYFERVMKQDNLGLWNLG
jgi:hypothetical protein